MFTPSGTVTILSPKSSSVADAGRGYAGVEGSAAVFTAAASADRDGDPLSYPSPDVNPITAVFTATHAYTAGGTYPVAFAVEDDEGGLVAASRPLALG